MPFRLNNSPGGVERLVSALCYMTGGIAGIIYIIISRSSYQSDFFRFHFLQSIVLVILSLLLNFSSGALRLMLGALLPVGGIELFIDGLITVMSLLAIYGIICAAIGKYAEIPFISNLVRQQMR